MQALFHANAYRGMVLGIKSGDTLATVEQKRLVKGVCGWRVSYGKNQGKGFFAESKASSPSGFNVSLLCSCNYTIEILA